MYNEISKTKIIAILIGVSIMILAFTLIPVKARTIEIAIVNPENGDIAIAYEASGAPGIAILWYDKDGNELLYKFVRGGSYVNMIFKENCLHITQGRVGSYAYQRDGKSCNAMTKEDIELQAKEVWEGWQSHKGGKEYVLDNRRYRYEYAPYPKSLFEYDCYVYIDNITEGTSTCIAHLKNHS